ncbi:type II secretion system protein GspL [Acinetobacter sp. BSP-153]|uniref:type II secretion system protein GspL n=1 Tax=Acinetobacter sp. BSP-153 TaxID=3344663 RepID=UPI00377048AF
MLQIWMPEADGTWHWSTGERWQTAYTLEQLIQDIQAHHGEEATVFFPSRDVQMIQQNIPKAQYKQLGAEGVRYLLEEYVLSSIDQMKVLHHFQAPEQLTVLGIANHRLETLQHALSLIPVKLVSLLPDFLILPEPTAEQVILGCIEERLLFRSNTWLGGSIDDLSVFLDYQVPEQKYKICNFTASHMHSLSARVTQEQLESFHYEWVALPRAKQHPWNVLPKVKEQSSSGGYWKACAAVLVALIVTQLAYDTTRWYQNKKIADQVAVQAVDQFKYWFGANYPVTEQTLRSQFEYQLKMNKQADAQALSLLSRVGPVLMQQQIVANQVVYEANTLNMQLKANSADALQALTQQLNQQGFQVELGNIQPTTGGAIGMVKIQ